MSEQSRFPFYLRCLFALLAGSAIAFAFAPFHYYILAIVSSGVLLFIWQEENDPRRAFILGWIYGVGQFGVGISWVYVSIKIYGETPFWFALLLTILLIAFLSLYPAFQGYFIKRFFPKTNATQSLLAYPSSWVVVEWLRSHFLTGFPWLLLGYSQTNTLFGSWAPIIGTYGVTFIVTLTSAMLLFFLRTKNKFNQLLVTALFLSLIFVTWIFSLHSWTASLKKNLTFSLIQGNIAQSLKWSESNFENSLNRYQQLTEKHWNSDLIVWPEAAIAMPYDLMQDFINSLDELAKAHRTTLITGIPFSSEQKGFYYNGMLALGEGTGRYYKQKLVVYAETLPFQFLFQGMLDHFNLPAPNVVAGASEQSGLTVKDQRIAPFICYDIAYSNVVRNALPEAALLLTLSDDAWFGRSFAQAQHLEISAMRSLQTGRFQLTATNNGLTAIIDNYGRVVEQLKPFEDGVLSGKVELMTGSTPWVIWGDNPILILSLFVMSFGVYQRFKVLRFNKKAEIEIAVT